MWALRVGKLEDFSRSDILLSDSKEKKIISWIFSTLKYWRISQNSAWITYFEITYSQLSRYKDYKFWNNLESYILKLWAMIIKNDYRNEWIWNAEINKKKNKKLMGYILVFKLIQSYFLIGFYSFL